MRIGKATLGYSSRTAAVLALQANGLNNRQIADRVNIPVSTVSALLSSAHRSRKVVGSSGPAAQRSFAALETLIMDLWEAGKSAERIAEEADVKLTTVRSVLAYMREGVAEQRLSKSSVELSSAALLAAIRRHHPERCSQ